MTTAAGMGRRFQQFDNDVRAEMIATIAATQSRQQNRLAEIAMAQDEHTATLAEHGSKLDRIIALLEQR